VLAVKVWQQVEVCDQRQLQLQVTEETDRLWDSDGVLLDHMMLATLVIVLNEEVWD